MKEKTRPLFMFRVLFFNTQPSHKIYLGRPPPICENLPVIHAPLFQYLPIKKTSVEHTITGTHQVQAIDQRTIAFGAQDQKPWSPPPIGRSVQGVSPGLQYCLTPPQLCDITPGRVLFMLVMPVNLHGADFILKIRIGILCFVLFNHDLNK